MYMHKIADWNVGKIADGSDVSGSIKVPECAHDTEEDEYVVGADSDNLFTQMI